ncbi:nuclear transport factor 2 family protein [Nocardia sp. NPDC058058]|uniref:nuclear transport factor 2 family protein n=1 Tax=Nocardia sp. NPDC058058 TaxID=3346317 RepID=UPI0036DCFEE3
MTTTAHTPETETGWPVAGLLLEALTRRDFTALSACLTPDVRFRGLIPPGPFDTAGAAAAETRFRNWFGGTDAFEVLDATAGRLGDKLYLRWRVRMIDDAGQARIAEQHVFATAGDHIGALDLLCSGWNPE